MSIDFSTLQGLSIPEGVVTQIADASGRVIWAVSGGKVILEVEKITNNTYAGNTTYNNEEFILLDIYPKTNGTVSVTYGGLTKTIIDTSGAVEPNAQQVFFGTFNGVSDSIATPASGTLTIEGDYVAFGIGSYNKAKASSTCWTGITSIIDFGTVEYIPSHAFGDVLAGGCTKLTKAKIPSSVTSIGDWAFFNCTGLTSVNIPSSVTSIGGDVFNDCTGLTSVNIPSSVTSIGDRAFYRCTGLTSINIPESVTSIGGSAFAYCEGLTSVNIPESVTSIGDSAFTHCTGLTSINIPESVTSIGDNPWSGCFVNNKITVTSGNTAYKIDANCLIEIATNRLVSGFVDSIIPSYITSIGDDVFNDCTGLTSVNIPSSVTSIGDRAFYRCTGLTSINIPESVTSIGGNAFAYCEGLTSVNLTEGLETIDAMVFYICTGLTSITIPASVTSIGTNAFRLDNGYTRTVTMLSATPATLGAANVFNDLGTHSIIVPVGSGDIYKAAKYWSNYADYIVEAS